MYQRKFIPLADAVRRIADRLLAEQPQTYVDDHAAIESARTQLLAALHEGAVRAEGVWWEVPGETRYEELPVEIDVWHPMVQEIWSHQRGEKYSDDFVVLDILGLHWKENWLDYYDNRGSLTEISVYKIRLHCADIDREFSRASNSAQTMPSSPKALPYKTGFAGRPSSRPLYFAEMHRRAEAGKLCDSLRSESQELADWLRREHPEAAQATAKTIENGLRGEYRKLKAPMITSARPPTGAPK